MNQRGIYELAQKAVLWSERAAHTDDLGVLWRDDTANRMRDAYLEVLQDLTGYEWEICYVEDK